MVATWPLTIGAATLIQVDSGSFLAIVAASAIAGTLAAVAGGRNLFTGWWSSNSGWAS